MDFFVKALQIRFGPSTYDDPMEALTRLKQTFSITVYKAQFESLSNRLKGLFEKCKLSYFLSGLKDEIRLLARMLSLINLGTIFDLAKIQEEYLLLSRKPWKVGGGFVEKKVYEKLGESSVKTQKEVTLIRKISSIQMDENRRKRLCYHCDDKWGPGNLGKNYKVY